VNFIGAVRSKMLMELNGQILAESCCVSANFLLGEKSLVKLTQGVFLNVSIL